MSTKNVLWLTVTVAAASGCGPEGPEPPAPLSVCPTGGPTALPTPTGHCTPGAPLPSYPLLTGPCRLGVSEPQHLLVTTTDFATGALSVGFANPPSVAKNVALGSTDAIPFYHDGLVYLVHRYGFDVMDVLDPCAEFASRGQFPLAAPDVSSSNPQEIAFRSDGLAFVSLFAAPSLAVLDLSKPPREAIVARVDLSAFADADGNPELGLLVACGETLFVTARRLDQSFQRTGDELLIPVDMASCQPYETALAFAGELPRQLRLDPSDPAGQRLLALTTGLERIDLGSGARTWAVDAAAFAAHGMRGYQLQSFALTADGTQAMVAAYRDEEGHRFDAIDIWAVELDGSGAMRKVLGGFNSVERTLEVLGATLWYGDTTIGASGLRAFDLDSDPPLELEGPLSTGLPPYSITAMP